MLLFVNIFVLLLVCNQVAPYFAVGETFGFSSMEEPSWSSSVGNNDAYEYDDQYVNDRLPDNNPKTTTLVQSTTTETTTTLPPVITTTPKATTKRQRVQRPDKGRRTLPEETNREIPRIDEPDQSDDRLKIVNTILAFKNIVRSIETEMGEVKQTCELCSDNFSVDDNTVCESSKDADTTKIKQQLRDIKSSVRNIDATLTHLSNTVNTIGAHMNGMHPRDCMDMFTRGQTGNGVYYIQPRNVDRPLLASCDMSDGGGWTIIQRRTDSDTDFDRGMGSYRRGFGDPNDSHWLGLDTIHSLLKQDEYQLRIEIQLYSGRQAHAYYKYFKIGDYDSNYVLTVGNYNGTAGDSLSYHNGMPFTTNDRDNDRSPAQNCATTFTGGWWYSDCLYTNLNGLNIGKEETDSSGVGIIWYDITGFHSSLQYASMAVRPTS